MRDLATLTGEEAMLLRLCEEWGRTPSELGRALWSSELTALRARAIVDAAAREVDEELRKKAASKEKQRAGRRKR